MTDIIIPYHSGRIFILADLHLDHWRRAGSNPLVDSGIEHLLRTDPDALIVAGDLINGPPHNWLEAINFLAAYIAPDHPVTPEENLERDHPVSRFQGTVAPAREQQRHQGRGRR